MMLHDDGGGLDVVIVQVVVLHSASFIDDITVQGPWVVFPGKVGFDGLVDQVGHGFFSLLCQSVEAGNMLFPDFGAVHQIKMKQKELKILYLESLLFMPIIIKR